MKNKKRKWRNSWVNTKLLLKEVLFEGFFDFVLPVLSSIVTAIAVTILIFRDDTKMLRGAPGRYRNAPQTKRLKPRLL